jgi:hypothetical protein
MSLDNSLPTFVALKETNGDIQLVNVDHISQIFIYKETETLEISMSDGETIEVTELEARKALLKVFLRNAFGTDGQPFLTDVEKQEAQRRSTGFQTKVNTDPPRR